MADPGQDFLQGYFGQINAAQQRQQQQIQQQQFAQTMMLHQQNAQREFANQQSEAAWRTAQAQHQANLEKSAASTAQTAQQEALAKLLGGGATRINPQPGDQPDPQAINLGGQQLHIPGPDEVASRNQATALQARTDATAQGHVSIQRLLDDGHIEQDTADKLEAMNTFDPNSIKGTDVLGAFKEKSDKDPLAKMTPGELFVDTITHPEHYGQQSTPPHPGITTGPVDPEQHPLIKQLDSNLHKAISKDPDGALAHPTLIKDAATVRSMALQGIQASAMVAPGAATIERNTEDKDFADVTNEMAKVLPKDLSKATAAQVLPAYFQAITKLTAERRGKPLSSEATIKALHTITGKLPENEQKKNILEQLGLTAPPK